MAITLGAITLPSGLVWSDETAWTPVSQTTEYSLTGALIVQESVKQAGRPITLSGQQDGIDYTAWLTRSEWQTLSAALTVLGATFTLTLHDARTFRVMARQDGDGPLQLEPGAVTKTFSPANPDSTARYILKALRLMEAPA